jgi:hypothetical protein
MQMELLWRHCWLLVPLTCRRRRRLGLVLADAESECDAVGSQSIDSIAEPEPEHCCGPQMMTMPTTTTLAPTMPHEHGEDEVSAVDVERLLAAAAAVGPELDAEAAVAVARPGIAGRRRPRLRADVVVARYYYYYYRQTPPSAVALLLLLRLAPRPLLDVGSTPWPDGIDEAMIISYASLLLLAWDYSYSTFYITQGVY